MISGNHRPKLLTVDEAIRRRMNLIPFTVNFRHPVDRRDKQLKEKLRKEWGGILQWMVEGCLKWQRDGLRPPLAVTNATEAYLGEQDALGRWLEERTEKNVNSQTSPLELYQDFRRWAEAAKEPWCSEGQFSQRLVERGFERGKGHGGVRFFRMRFKQQTKVPKFQGKLVAMPNKHSVG
jgi:putative DNA primase/helicase